MTIPEMAAMAREHWKSVNPKVYQQMKKNKELVACSEAATRLTQREMQAQMLVNGNDEAKAWEASRELFILTDPAKEYHPDYD